MSEADGMERFTIEAADPHGEDATRLSALLSAELGARYGGEGEGGYHPDQVCVPGAVFVIARLDGRPVGCGALRPLTAEVGEIKRMYVDPTVRGRGISRRILQELEDRGRRFGYARLRLEAGTMQVEALRLYESSGYYHITPYGYFKDDPRSICFEKLLT
jgi:GNAT superfamily N-acetyltransferase